MNIPQERLLGLMTDVARSLTDPVEARNALQVITYSAREAIPGVDEVSISISHLGGTVETLTSTSQFVVQADLLQYELGEGPCVEAIKTCGDVDVEDMAPTSAGRVTGRARRSSGSLPNSRFTSSRAIIPPPR